MMKDLAILLNLLELGTWPMAEIVRVVIISRRQGMLMVMSTELGWWINCMLLLYDHSFCLVMLLW